jgi:hypothetical protein
MHRVLDNKLVSTADGNLRENLGSKPKSVTHTHALARAKGARASSITRAWWSSGCTRTTCFATKAHAPAHTLISISNSIPCGFCYRISLSGNGQDRCAHQSVCDVIRCSVLTFTLREMFGDKCCDLQTPFTSLISWCYRLQFSSTPSVCGRQDNLSIYTNPYGICLEIGDDARPKARNTVVLPPFQKYKMF